MTCKEVIAITRCAQVLALSPEMGFRPYEEELYRTFVQIIVSDAEPEDLISILVWENGNRGFDVLSSTGVGKEELASAGHSFLASAAQWVVAHHQPLVLPGKLPELQQAMLEAGFASAAMFPMCYRRHVAGCLTLARRHGPSPFRFADLALVTLFANILSDIFERLRLIEVIQGSRKAVRRAKIELNRIQALRTPPLGFAWPDTLDMAN